MKLDIKHLAPYLPYGITLYVFGQTKLADYIVEAQRLTSDGSIYFAHDYNFISGNEDYFKPILRLLTDLTKEIEHNGDTFVPYEKILLYCNDESFSVNQKGIPLMYLDGSWEFPNNWTYEIMVLLFEWKFDVFGLIEQGLAIDLNTIK